MSDPVIEVKDMGASVVRVKMQDKAHKNTFSKELSQGLNHAFEEIKNSDYKAVILTGYDNYFSSGGTQESLLDLHEGKGRFTDMNLYSLALDCPVPVISAMQGHGIGGGFVMGLFADFVLLGRECVYTTNFMRYGFTPGMGATLILPQKLGISLAEEMLLLAKTYRGEELRQRGVPFPVLPRQEIGEYALEMAYSLAEKPRLSLITLKNHLVASLREQLPQKIEQELAMHAVTFHQEEVKGNIEVLFGK